MTRSEAKLRIKELSRQGVGLVCQRHGHHMRARLPWLTLVSVQGDEWERGRYGVTFARSVFETDKLGKHKGWWI